MEEAIENAKKRAKQEFPSVRSIVKVICKESKKEDKEYINDLSESTRTTSETISEETNKVNHIENKTFAEQLVDKMSDEIKQKKVWRVVFTPGRKPRKRDYDTNFFVVEANSINEAREEAKRQLAELDVKFKDKWSLIVPDTIENVAKSKAFKNFEENNHERAQQAQIEVIEPVFTPVVGKSFDASNIDKNLFKNFKQVGIKTDGKKHIIEIYMNGVNIFDRQNFKTYYLKPTDTKNKYPQIKVETVSAANAITLFKFVLQAASNEFDYSDCIDVSILDTEGNMRTIDFKDIISNKE